MKTPIIFDLDGVIVDSERHWRRVSHEFLRALIPSWGEADQRAILGMSATAVFERLRTEYGVELSWEEYLQSYERLAAEIYGQLAEPLPGVLELIAFLSQAGYPLAIASSAPRVWVDLVLERFFLRPKFSAVVTADDVGKLTKPAPEPYLLAAERLRRKPEECLAFEDSPKGITSAKAAGMRCVAIAPAENAPRDVSQADLVLGTFEAVPVRGFEDWVKARVALPKSGELR